MMKEGATWHLQCSLREESHGSIDAYEMKVSLAYFRHQIPFALKEFC